MDRAFTITNFPYLFTLLVAIVGAQLNYLIEDTLSTPLVEYTLSPVDGSLDNQVLTIGKKEVPVIARSYKGRISNITKSFSFKDVQLTIVFPEGRVAVFRKPVFEPVPPSALNNWQDVVGSRGLEYTIAHFQPGFEYTFSFDVLTSDPDTIPKPYLQSSSTVHLKERSWLTKLVRYQSAVNLSIFIILLVVLSLYLAVFIKKKEKRDAE